MWAQMYLLDGGKRRTSHEVRGLKFYPHRKQHRSPGRTSHEVRGLKLPLIATAKKFKMSHLTRGAWIEITNEELREMGLSVAPHTRCVD